MPRGDVFVDNETTYRDTIKDRDGKTVDLSSAQIVDNPAYVFTKPDGTVFERTGAFVTDGTDGRIEYTMASGEQDQDGVWLRQVTIAFTNGTFSTEIKTQLVLPRLGS